MFNSQRHAGDTTDKRKVLLAAAAAALALALAPGLAHAATNVDVNYTDPDDGTAKTVTVDLETLPIDTNTYGYLFQKGGVNNVVVADQSVSLNAALTTAIAEGGNAPAQVWRPGKTLTFTVDGGQAYSKYTDFTYARLMGANYFWGSTLMTGTPTGDATQVPTVLALNGGAMAMDAATPTAQAAVSKVVATGTDATKAPRLLWGWPSADVPSDQFGGNRYPTNIDSITIS